jgi:hypothetical protein
VTTEMVHGPTRAAALPQDILAREVQARTHGTWLCWYGRHTRRFWAMRRQPALAILVDGDTAADLTRVMADVDAYYGR